MPKFRKQFNATDFCQALEDDRIAMESFKRLCVEGHGVPKNLIALIAAWCCSAEIFEKRKKELDSLKSRLDRLQQASNDLADEIDCLGRDRLEIFGRRTIGEVLIGGYPTKDGEHWIIPPSSKPLGGMSDQLRENSETLAKLREAWGDEYSVRNLTPTIYQAQLYFYCCEVARTESISYRDLANVLAKAAAVHNIPQPTEDLLRKNVEGFQGRLEIAQECALLRGRIRGYVEHFPNGLPTFMDWMAKPDRSQKRTPLK